MEARIKLQNTKLSKSGHNKFAGYQYFELGDFLPAVQVIFNEIGLCGTITFDERIATLEITDMAPFSQEDKPPSYERIMFTCPMATAALKGCHDVQNLGASMTYIRRYLWVNALEIVEHDALDATVGMEGKGKGVHKPTQNENYQPDEATVRKLSGIVDMVLSKETKYGEAAKFLESENLDSDDKVWVWDKLDSKTRSGIKKYHAEQKAKIADACFNEDNIK